MRVQSVVFSSEYCSEKELFYRGENEHPSDETKILVPEGETILTDTYQNLFDTAVWFKYTGVSQWNLCLEVKGKGTVSLYRRVDEKKELLSAHSFESKESFSIRVPFTSKSDRGYVFFEVHANKNVEILSAGYHTDQKSRREISLCALFCTYHRNEEINRNLNQLLQSDFFDEESPFYHKLRIIVSDNGSELDYRDEVYLKLYHNPNTGGSGGFKRCLQELRSNYDEAGITNVIFMDDDVEFLNESLYRLYAFLTYLQTAYEDSVVAGRMFRSDSRWVQYTAAEIWNAGDLRHIGLNTDMTERSSLVSVNENTGAEYGGWWFCCYPYAFSRENDPLPFFLHCDDVEYGLRYGSTPIILNGVHVWHPTFEYRQNAIIAYYDIRNSLIVNAMFGFLKSNKDFRNYSLLRIVGYREAKEHEKEYMAIRATQDFLKGKKWFFSISSEEYHKRLIAGKRHGKNRNYISQLFLRLRFRKKSLIADSYKNQGV